MNSLFVRDNNPQGARILFVGPGESTHTHSWIDLLKDSNFNVRLFSTSESLPPRDWPIKTYVATQDVAGLDQSIRCSLFESGKLARVVNKVSARARGQEWNLDWAVNDWLLQVVREWKPHIVHTLGLDAARFYLKARRRLADNEAPRWVLQTRGGSDLQLVSLDPQHRPELASTLMACDQLVCDNLENFRIARELGVSEKQLAPITPVPGTGGIDTGSAIFHSRRPTSARRMILWPKAYETPWGKVLPVFEALKLCWDRIQPAELQMLSADYEARMWYWTLPAEMQKLCHINERLTRAETLGLMAEARVMLAPSLVDGVPNSMYEAMAAQAFPIVSPLDTIRSVVREEENVLFARNLYPHEIADALVRAMTDDALVDDASKNNLELVRQLADRNAIRPRVIEFYEQLAREKRS